MKSKLILLILCIALHNSGFGQKIILINDSTSLKHYFGKERKVISIGADKKPIEKIETVIELISLPKLSTTSKHDGLDGGPVIRVLRNNHSSFFDKKIKATVYSLDLSNFLNTSKLNYRAYFDESSKIDSLVFFFSYRDTSRSSTDRYFWKEELIETIEERVQNDYKTAIKEAIAEFLQSNLKAASGHLTGYISLNFEKKDLDVYLNSLSDTVSSIALINFGLRHFPDQLKRFKNLKSIDLKDNFIDHAVINKKDFPKLKFISFQQNLLRDKHLSLKGVKIKTLNLSDNYFSSIPKTHKKVKHLLLANNSINQVTKNDIKRIRKAELLNLYSNQITSLNPRISKLKKLKELDLYRNRISELPEEITRLKKLEALALSYNQLKVLPQELSNLKSLKILYAHHNQLLDLPNLPSGIETLDIGYNRLQKVDDYVKPLKNLKTLDYSNNFVKGDLNFLLELPHIKEIYFFENRYASSEDEEKYFSDVFYKLVSKGVTVK